MGLGSSLAPTLASFAMNLIESQIVVLRAYMYVCPYTIAAVYMTFSVIFATEKHGYHFLDVVNPFHKNIHFALEAEHNNSLKLLDVIVHKSVDKFENAVLKDTNTDECISKYAFGLQRYKRSAIWSLIFHSKYFSTCSVFYDSFLQIRDVFLCNGYHLNYINKIKEEVDYTIYPKPDYNAR